MAELASEIRCCESKSSPVLWLPEILSPVSKVHYLMLPPETCSFWEGGFSLSLLSDGPGGEACAQF